MAPNKVAEDTGFLVDTARSQLQRLAEERSDCMAAVQLDNSLQRLIMNW